MVTCRVIDRATIHQVPGIAMCAVVNDTKLERRCSQCLHSSSRNPQLQPMYLHSVLPVPSIYRSFSAMCLIYHQLPTSQYIHSLQQTRNFWNISSTEISHHSSHAIAVCQVLTLPSVGAARSSPPKDSCNDHTTILRHFAHATRQTKNTVNLVISDWPAFLIFRPNCTSYSRISIDLQTHGSVFGCSRSSS